MRAHQRFDNESAAMNKLILFCLIALPGCAVQPARVVEVPVRQSCVGTIAAKPQRLTPCPKPITDSQCVKRAALDIERLQSAVDQLTVDLEACR